MIIIQLIHSKDWWDVENGLTILESASLTYGEMNPQGLIEIVVGMMGPSEYKPILLGLLNQEATPIDIQMMSISCMSCVVMRANDLFIPFAVVKRGTPEV